jgi:hypothetical protein
MIKYPETANKLKGVDFGDDELFEVTEKSMVLIFDMISTTHLEAVKLL